MKKTKEDILNILNSLSEDDIKRMAYSFLRIREHIWREFDDSINSEKRTREKLRLEIAKKYITKWSQEYGN